MTLTIDTDHGPYDVLPYRDSDNGPDGAILTVFRDGGSIAGFAVCPYGDQWVARMADGRHVGRISYATPEGAAAIVADSDRD
jgi:hypothetical protein